MPNTNWLFRLTFFSFGVVICFFGTNLARAADYTETFNSTLTNPSFWSSTRGVLVFGLDESREYGSMQVASGVNPYHYYKSVDFSTLKPDYSSILLTVKFSSNPINQGAGYILSDNVPNVSTSLDFANYMFYLWPKIDGTFHIFSSLCPDTNPACNVGLQLANGVYALPTDGAWHDIELRRTSSHYEWLVDNVVVFTTVDTLRTITSIGIGDPEDTTGFLTWPSLFIDFIGLDANLILPSPAPSPSVVPSPSPSIAPSPSPSLIPSPSPSTSPSASPLPSISPVPSGYPYYSQKNPLWGSQVYDHAQQWASAGKRGIERWGCALTSAAMVLKNYGVKSASGLEATPAVLNSWLRIQRDGYLRNGLLNWLAVSRFTHQSKLAGQSPTELEFRKSSYNESDVETEIAGGKAPILGLPGHFVLSHSDMGDSYGINDPADTVHTSLNKSEDILTSNVYTPSLTDLSYMLYAYDPGISVAVKDATGAAVVGIESEEWLHDDVSGGEGAHLKLLYVPKPSSGNYTLEITNATSGKGVVDVYMYDTRGNVKKDTFTVTKESELTVDLTYNRTRVERCKAQKRHTWFRHFYRLWRWHR